MSVKYAILQSSAVFGRMKFTAVSCAETARPWYQTEQYILQYDCEYGLQGAVVATRWRPLKTSRLVVYTWTYRVAAKRKWTVDLSESKSVIIISQGSVT